MVVVVEGYGVAEWVGGWVDGLVWLVRGELSCCVALVECEGSLMGMWQACE